MLPDGTLADVNIDFKTLHDLSHAARHYDMGGAVQHGASTLPESAFGKFVEAQAIEVHLATAFQTILFESLPKAINEEVNTWLFANAADERKSGETDAQFLYKTKKKAIGPFKKQMWNLPESDRAKVRAILNERFGMLFDRLGVGNTTDIVAKFVNAPEQHKSPTDYGAAPLPAEDVSGLAD